MPGITDGEAPRDATAEGLAALLEEATRLAAADPGAALALLDELDLAPGTDALPDVGPAATYLRARITLDRGDPATALRLIDAARERYLAAGLELAALRTDLGRMHALDDLGRHEDAAEIGRRLLDELSAAQQSGDEALEPEELHPLRAAAEGNLGAALGFLGRHDEAVEAYRRSEGSWRSSGALPQAAAALANQGIELTELGRPGAAVERLEAAAAVFDAAGDRAWFAKCLGHLGEALAAAGWLADALTDFHRARAILNEIGARTEAWRVAIMTASAFTRLGMSHEALAVVAAVEPELRSAGLRHDLASALCAKGMALSSAGRGAGARAALAEAVEIYTDVHDPPNTARALLGEAALVPAHDARALVERAADLLAPGNWPGIRCLVTLRLAELSSDGAEALSLTEKAASMADELALPHVRQAVSLHQGALRLRLGDLDGGIERLGQALAEVEQIGSRIHDDLLRTAYRNSCITAQDALVEALLLRGRPADLARAAALSDQFRAQTLSESMRTSAASRPSASDVDAALWEELQAAYSALFAADARSHPSLRATVTELERRLSLRRALSAGRGGPPEPLRLDRRASTDVITVAYHVFAQDVVAFVSNGAGTRVRRGVTDRRRVTALLEDLEAHLGGHAVAAISAHPEARAQACRDVLRELYLAVFAPVAELLPPVTESPAPLLVVPHGPLHRIPFHALHDGTGFLLRDWVISVSPSIEVAQLASARPARSGPALVVGVTDEATSFVEREARTVAGVYPSARVLINGEATLAAVRSAASDAGVVHLACHGLFRGDNLAYSSFRLADRWVGADDIASFSLDGAVLVLSACESGRSGAGGEQAAGLARGFLSAGARSVVVSQWLADDRCTAELMVNMHHHLAGDADPAAALRAAQLTAIDSYPHPFHWAPFVAVGAPTGPEVT